MKVAYKKRERAQKRKEMEVLMKDNLLNILTVPGTPIRCETQGRRQYSFFIVFRIREAFKIENKKNWGFFNT